MFFWNRIWSLDRKIFNNKHNLAVFVGELEDIPDTRFSFLLPNRREYARKYYNFVGYITDFNPEEFRDKGSLCNELGYGDEPLVICSIGGTAIGKNLLELCGEAYIIAKRQIPGLHMILVCGPRLPAASLDVPSDVEIRQYVPELYKHFAASDLAIVQARGTTTLELAALRKPFIYFPIEGHSEQEIVVAGRLQRYQAGVRMSYTNSTPESLAEIIVANINNTTEYKDIPIKGAVKIARFVNELL